MKFPTLCVAGLALASTSAFGQFLTSEPSYLNATAGADFTFSPIITVGDRVPVTAGTGPVGATDFAFCGIPDAMGIFKDSVTGENVLFLAHEVPNTGHQRPFPGATRYKGAWVSRFVLNGTTGAVQHGSAAHKNLFLGDTLQASRPPQEGDAASFTRFCSGSFAGREHGMDRPLFFTNEESASGTYNSNGSLAVVIADGDMHTLPGLGRIVRETTIVQPRRDSKTVIICTEDGPVGSNVVSYIYMYVGEKLRRSDSVLDKNGLNGGKLYVLAGRDAHHNEGTFTTGTLATKWVEIVGASTLTDVQISTAADNAGGFGFVRVEDAEYDPAQPTRSVFFTTTGGSGPNRLGRVYELTMNPTNPVANGTLNVVINSDRTIYPGGSYSGAATGKLIAPAVGALGTYNPGTIGTTDYPVSADNIAVSDRFIVICEDRNSPADAVFANFNRNGGTWTLDRTNGYAAKLQCTFNYAYTEARDGNTLGSTSRGQWETSGVIRTDEIFGAGTFMINVQAHPTNANYHRSNISKPGGGTYTKAEALFEFAEDGQLLIMRPVP